MTSRKSYRIDEARVLEDPPPTNIVVWKASHCDGIAVDAIEINEINPGFKADAPIVPRPLLSQLRAGREEISLGAPPARGTAVLAQQREHVHGTRRIA